MKINGYTLASLKRGQKGVIKSVDASDPQVQRLMVLGLVEGTEIEHASSAIGGDPMEFRLFGRSIERPRRRRLTSHRQGAKKIQRRRDTRRRRHGLGRILPFPRRRRGSQRPRHRNLRVPA